MLKINGEAEVVLSDRGIKQLNFVQHIKTMLKINGEAEVVLSDNVLFEGSLLLEEEIVTCKTALDYEPASILLARNEAQKKKK